MALESAPYINGLVSSNPAAGDALAQSDDHMRLIKAAILATFPNITGAVTPTHTELNALQAAAAAAVSLTGTQTLTNKTLTAPVVNTAVINSSPIGGATPAAGAFTTLSATGAVAYLPTGIICLWSGASTAIPTGWKLCDGTLGTPDLRGKFIVGAAGTYAVAAAGGSADAIAVSHTHTATSTVTDPGHNHATRAPAGGYTLATAGASNGGAVGSGTGNTDLRGSTYQTSDTTGVTVATTVASGGASGTNANLPPYYALCYIMRA